MFLKVVGAGFGRTGTLSLKCALEHLSFGPCYHMIETVAHPEHDAMWLAIARGESHDWRAIFEGYHSTVDWPAISVWKELAAAYPQAKVVLTVRDPESWYESASNTIFARMLAFEALIASGAPVDPTRKAHMTMVNTVVVKNAFGGCLEKRHAIDVFNAHNAEVRRIVPPNKLLVYESGDGWGPLCAFLGVPAPEAPYPKVNTTDDFTALFPIKREP
jgi:hypothetical protein